MKLSMIILLCPLFLLGQIDHWESLVIAENNCTYFIGNSNPPTDWYKLEYNDELWKSGTGGIGYGDEDDGTIISPTNSVFLRYTFDLLDLNSIESVILHADYDDAFIAYLNGEEIFRNNIEGEFPEFNAAANELHESNIYRGQQPEAYDFNESHLELLIQGTNVLSLQVHNYDGASSSDLSSNFFLSAGIKDSSRNYQETPSWFKAPVGDFSSNLPIFKITTQEYIPDEPKVPGQLAILWNENGAPNLSTSSNYQLQTNIAIERRGQTSLSLFPKNGYGFELRDSEDNDIDLSLVGLPEEEDWILNGPYSDKTLIRNVLAMELANRTGSYNSRTRFIELILNDEYQGVYVLMEKIKRDKNRIDIAKLTEEDIEGDELTGGYVFKIDKDTPDWYSDYNIQDRAESLAFQYVSPSRGSILPEQETYLQTYIDSFERALNSPNYWYGGKRYNDYVDLVSFADHFIIKELAKDVDAYRISSYYYKDKDSNGGKLYAGPVWDFNIAFGNINYCEGNTRNGWMYEVNCDAGIPFWWSRMMADPQFRNVLQCRWRELSSSFLNKDKIYELIDNYKATLGSAIERNFTRWPIIGNYVWPNNSVPNSYEGEINELKQFIESRLYWMNLNIDDMCESVSTDELDDFAFRCFPNPFLSTLTLEFSDLITETLKIRLYSTIGQCLYIEELSPINRISHTIELEDLDAGLYYLEIETQRGKFGKVVIK